MNEVAAFLYESFADGYATSWATASNKPAWRRCATAVLNAIQDGTL